MRANPSLTSTLEQQIALAIEAARGWIGFEQFMQLALYAPGMGYYAGGDNQFGLMPRSGAACASSDFVTAPELSPCFGQTLAVQVRQALDQHDSSEIWEFGAGSGALAGQLLDALGERVTRYHIVDLSVSLMARQRETLQRHAKKLVWEQRLPDALEGVVVGNEVLDAMPVKLLQRRHGQWLERGVALRDHAAPCANAADAASPFAWADRPTHLHPPLEIAGEHDYLTEIHPQAEAFVRTLAQRLLASERGGAVFLIDYGFPEAEYYHPQRHMGTLMCHRAHRVDAEPLQDVGLKDLTAHVNFTGVALAAQEAGLQVLGYCSQARFLLNCGLPQLLEHGSLQERGMAQKLIMEHEMGELFKIIAFGTGPAWSALGFAQGDRTHTL